MMNTCKTCKHWQSKHPEFIADFNRFELFGVYQTTTGKLVKSEDQAIADTGYAVRWCTRSTEMESRPKQNGVAFFGEFSDGSAMATGQDFGCILHEVV
jgi:hypothetical protein